MGYRPSVTIIVTVYNGRAFLREKIESLLALDYPEELREILVVSDGSTDGSDEIAASFAPRGIRLLSVPHGGKPAAINAALPLATSDEFLRPKGWSRHRGTPLLSPCGRRRTGRHGSVLAVRALG